MKRPLHPFGKTNFILQEGEDAPGKSRHRAPVLPIQMSKRLGWQVWGMFLIVRKGQVFAVFFMIAAAVAAIFCSASLFRNAQAATAPQAVNWGLGFSEEGKAPTGTVTAVALLEKVAWYVGSSEEKKIYLTFDAGYEAGYTASILDVLKKHNVKAAFFLVGNYIETAPELVQRMVEEGHTVGNHTYHHYDMSKIADMEKFQKEISALETVYKEITGEDMPKYYRPPQGKYCEANLDMAQQLGYKTIFWSLAYVDWYQDNQPTREQAFQKLIPRIHPGAVVLLHSTSKTNAEILDELLTRWEDMGYTFGELSQLTG